MLMRLLDRKDPLFLLEESDVMRDASGWDSTVTSFPSVPIGLRMKVRLSVGYGWTKVTLLRWQVM